MQRAVRTHRELPVTYKTGLNRQFSQRKNNVIALPRFAELFKAYAELLLARASSHIIY